MLNNVSVISYFYCAQVNSHCSRLYWLFESFVKTKHFKIFKKYSIEISELWFVNMYMFRSLIEKILTEGHFLPNNCISLRHYLKKLIEGQC